MDKKIHRCQGNKKYLCTKLNIIFTDNYQSSTFNNNYALICSLIQEQQTNSFTHPKLQMYIQQHWHLWA